MDSKLFIWDHTLNLVFLLTIIDGVKMDYNKYIARNPNIMLGKPTIIGTRITIELIMRKFAGGYTIEDIILSYPHLNKEQISAAFEYAADLIANEEVFEIA